MADPDPKKRSAGTENPKQEAPEKEQDGGGRSLPAWVRPVLAGLALLAVSAGVGFGIGRATSSEDPGPDLTRDEAFARAREETRSEVARQMRRRGFIAGTRTGRNHGIIAGGMAAESAVTVRVRRMRADEAQNNAASVQSQLAGMTGGAPAVPGPEAFTGD